MINTRFAILSISLTITPFSVLADGNTTIQSFNQAKKLLLSEVYAQQSDRQTIYCGADFDSRKNVTLPSGFTTEKYKNRLARYETEHVVPAENFGRTFVEWREGDLQCVNSKGQSYKGRRCASKASQEYRLMQSDMYNLFPAIGSVNAARQNYNFTMLPGEKSDFGDCEMKIDNRKAEPPIRARGHIARTYLYMEQTYPRYHMSKSQRQLMTIWDKQYPVSEWECLRASRIEAVQGNANLVLKTRCNNQ